MENIETKKTTELDFGNVSAILSTGAAAGKAIAKFASKSEQIGGMIGGGLSLLATGLIVGLDKDTSAVFLKKK